MANFQTVQGLVTLVRARTDQTNSPTFSDTAELIPWVRQSLAQLHELLVSRWLDWYVIRRPLTLGSNQEFYALPPDFRAMQDVYLLYSGGLYREKLSLIPHEQVGRYNNQQNAWGRWDVQYRIQNNSLYLTPIGTTQFFNFQNAIELWYTPTYKAPLLNTSTIDLILPNGWEEWVVLDVMEKMKVKLNFDMTMIANQKQEQANRLLAASSVRDGEAPQMTDSYENSARRLWVNAVPGGPAFWTGT
jgi:hypothetical protein